MGATTYFLYFFSVTWVGLQSVIVAVPGHTYLFTVCKGELRALVNCFMNVYV